MAETKRPGKPKRKSTRKAFGRSVGGGANDPNLRLLILLVRSESALDELITGMLDVGVTGASIVESKGMGAIIRKEMPMFAGLASLLPQHTGSRIVFCLCTAQLIERLGVYIDEMHSEDRPIAIVLPVEQVFGYFR